MDMVFGIGYGFLGSGFVVFTGIGYGFYWIWSGFFKGSGSFRLKLKLVF